MKQHAQRIRYRFVGRVQRRGFRYACMTCAERANVVGWVKNERDGSVTAEVQGEAQDQLLFLQKLTTLVPGYGDGWSIASEQHLELEDGEDHFGVRR